MPKKSPGMQCILFDWGDTLMRVFPEFDGPMYLWPEVELIDGARETLAELRREWRLVVATNAADSEEGDIWSALQRVGVDELVDKIYCFRVIGHKKPSPMFFEYILDDLSVDREAVVMVGDDFEADVLGAIRSGIRGIWLNRRSEEMRAGEMYRTIHDMRALPEALNSFGIA